MKKQRKELKKTIVGNLFVPAMKKNKGNLRMIFGVQEGDNMKKILLLSNMYPSKKFPHYGIFVKNTENILIENNYIV